MRIQTCILLALIIQPLHAQSEVPATVEACKACHGVQGISRNPTFPNLAGQKAEYLEAQLQAFKAKDRKNDYMNVIAAQLGDDDIHRFAQFWSSLPASPAPGPTGAAPAGPAIPSRTTMPADFPKGFTVYQTQSEDGTITRRYANSIAWKAAKAGQLLPDGSVLFQASYKAEKDSSGKEVVGAVPGVSQTSGSQQLRVYDGPAAQGGRLASTAHCARAPAVHFPLVRVAHRIGLVSTS